EEVEQAPAWFLAPPEPARSEFLEEQSKENLCQLIAQFLHFPRPQESLTSPKRFQTLPRPVLLVPRRFGCVQQQRPTATLTLEYLCKAFFHPRRQTQMSQ